MVVLFCALSFFFWDRTVARMAYAASPQVRKIFEPVTRLGVSTWYLVTSAAVFLFFLFVCKRDRYWKGALFLFSSVAVSGLLTDGLKMVFGRYRPKMLFEKGLYGFEFFRTGYLYNSFPSGHATTAGALATALCLVEPRYRVIYFAAGVAVMASRMILGAHYLSDVVSGFFIGAVTALLIKAVLERRGLWYPVRKTEDAGKSGIGGTES